MLLEAVIKKYYRKLSRNDITNLIKQSLLLTYRDYVSDTELGYGLGSGSIPLRKTRSGSDLNTNGLSILNS